MRTTSRPAWPGFFAPAFDPPRDHLTEAISYISWYILCFFEHFGFRSKPTRVWAMSLPTSSLWSRRAVLGGFAASALAKPAWTQPVANVEILAAPTTASILVARLLDSGGLTNALPNASFRLWHDPDELRAATVSKRSMLFTAPSHVPANLANRGLPIKLLGILGMGHLAIVTSDPTITKFADLAGKPVLGFFRNDMPDLVFRAVAQMEGLDPDKDIKLTYVGTPMETAQMLAAGRAETAILSEPPATAAIMIAAQQGRKLSRAIILQDVWIKHKGGDGIPMVSLGIHERLLEDTPELIPLLRSGLPQAKDWVYANRPDAAALAEKDMQYRPPIFLACLDHSAIKIMSAKAAQSGLEEFYKTILALSPGALDSRLPDAGFYLDL
jgi:NitT/TauT family transport system substrate-binding protein